MHQSIYKKHYGHDNLDLSEPISVSLCPRRTSWTRLYHNGLTNGGRQERKAGLGNKEMTAF